MTGETLDVNGRIFAVEQLLGKGKGGYIPYEFCGAG